MRNAAIMGLLGLTTGLVTVLINPFTGQVNALVRQFMAEAGWGADIWQAVATFGPGLIFGVVIGAWLHFRHRRSLWRWGLFAALTTASWVAAIFAAASLANAPLEWLPKSWGPNLRWLPGIAGGMVGAAFVAATLALLYPALRRVSAILSILLVGGLAGLPLFYQGFVVTFPLWQASVGIAIGFGLDRADDRSALR